MNALILLVVGLAALAAGYKFYGTWLSKQWGVGEGNKETPAHTMNDGVDYVPAKAPVLMGHHFSSIAGAGPITGPITAVAYGFGWLPCVLWIIIGGIFFGGVHDYGALFASVRHGGKSIGEIIAVNMSTRAKRLFIIFAYLALVLVLAAFASIVAGTFGATIKDGAIDYAASANAATVAMVSLLYIAVAIVFGFFIYRRNASVVTSTIVGVIAIIACIALGLNFHPIYLTTNQWMFILGIYIAIASVTPVWILLQPRDYLSSFLLYAMIAVALFAVIVAHPSLVNAEGVGLTMMGGNYAQPLFPVLFTTIACGAISGFHSLVSSGTTSKQLDKESDAKPIAYGGMLLECVLAILTLCAVAYAYQIGIKSGPTNIFAGGIAGMASVIAGGKGSALYNILFTLLVLTYSAFCLTTLDTATRLTRFMFQEFWIDSSKGETMETVTGYKKFLSNTYVATLISVVCGIGLGMTGYAKIWALFGSANQLLAGLGLVAVCTWLKNAGKNHKMFLIPMVFMVIVTISSLAINTMNQLQLISAGKADWGPYAQVVIAVLLICLAIVLVIEGFQTLSKKDEAKA